MKTAGIIAFAFGAPKTILANQRLARIASVKARELNAPVYTQLDLCIEPGIEVTYTSEISGNAPPTLRITRGAVAWAKRQGLVELWVVAAKPQLWRCARDLTRSVLDAGAGIAIHICPETEQFHYTEWFCKDSTISRARWPRHYRCYELILKLLPFSVYKRFAN